MSMKITDMISNPHKLRPPGVAKKFFVPKIASIIMLIHPVTSGLARIKNSIPRIIAAHHFVALLGGDPLEKREYVRILLDVSFKDIF